MIPDGEIAAATSELVRHHKGLRTQFDTTKSCDDALKQQILSAFHNDYVEGVENETVGFANPTTLELMNHLQN